MGSSSKGSFVVETQAGWTSTLFTFFFSTRARSDDLQETRGSEIP